MLISEDYRAQQAELHRTRDGYGVACLKYAEKVQNIASEYGISKILDYGAGKGRLASKLPDWMGITRYEPANPHWSEPPEPHDFVVCIDVLEHIEPDCLDAVLDDLRRVTKKVGYFTVNCKKAGKTLPDGRNAHLIVEPKEWWMPKIQSRFKIVRTDKALHGFDVLCEPLS